MYYYPTVIYKDKVYGCRLGLPMQCNRWVPTCYRSSIRICDNIFFFYFFFGGGGCWVIGINIQQLPIQTNVMGVDKDGLCKVIQMGTHSM